MKSKLTLAALLTSSILLTACDAQGDIKLPSQNDVNKSIKIAKDAKKVYDEFKTPNNSKPSSKSVNPADTKDLASKDFTSGMDNEEQINGGKSTLTWHWTDSHIDYSPLDEYNRVGRATAYLSKDNYGQSEGRDAQRWNPTGWNNQKRNQDRGHLIAYTISFNLDDDGSWSEGHDGSLDNPKNLFTQTSQSNRGAMQTYETLVRDEIKSGGKVIYQVTPVFRDSELMARGVHLEAISEDGDVNFNVYLYNVASGYTFDYATGRSQKDNSIVVN